MGIWAASAEDRVEVECALEGIVKLVGRMTVVPDSGVLTSIGNPARYHSGREILFEKPVEWTLRLDETVWLQPTSAGLRPTFGLLSTARLKMTVKSAPIGTSEPTWPPKLPRTMDI